MIVQLDEDESDSENDGMVLAAGGGTRAKQEF